MFARFKFSPRTSRSWTFRFSAAPSLLRFARSMYAPTAGRYGRTPHQGCVAPPAVSTDPGQDRERPERDHLARAARGLKRERGRSLVRMLRVPFGRGRARVRLHRVEDPRPVGPLLLAKEVERVPEPTVLPIAERGQTVEANQEVVVVVDGPVEAVPRLVPFPLDVEFVLQVVLRTPFDAVLHRRGPLWPRVGGEGSQSLPCIERPTGSRHLLGERRGAAPLGVRGLDQPVERLSDSRVILVAKADEPAGHVGGVAMVALPPPEPPDSASYERRLAHPVLAGLSDFSDRARRPEVRQRQHVPVGPQESGFKPTAVSGPPTGGVSAGKDVGCPPNLRDAGLRVSDVRIALLPTEELGQSKIPDRRLVRFEQPIEDLIARHRPSDPRHLGSSFRSTERRPCGVRLSRRGGPRKPDSAT